MRESEQGTLTNKCALLDNVYNLEDTIQADGPVEMIKNTGASSLSEAVPGSGAASHEDAPEKLDWFEENTL